MKYATRFMIALASLSLVACGKSEEAPAIDSPEPKVEPAPLVTPEPTSLEPELRAPQAESAAKVPSAAVAATETASPAPVQPVAPAKTPSAAPAAAGAAGVAAPHPELAHGQQIYRQACAFCHDKGVAGAPKTGDIPAWNPRLAQGMDALYAAAVRGKGAMPAKGGNPSLGDADVTAAVDYLVAQSR